VSEPKLPTICVGGEAIGPDAIGEMTRALRREAIYAQWDTLAVKGSVTLPNIVVGACLGDPRWTGWGARIEVKRLADAPGTGYRRWRTTVRVAMPGWFAKLAAVYVDAVPPLAAALASRQATADGRAAIAEELRGPGGLTIWQAAAEMGRLDPDRGAPDPATIVRYRSRKRGDSRIS
jgi:hypothetical protein